jgi:hypothetical protein
VWNAQYVMARDTGQEASSRAAVNALTATAPVSRNAEPVTELEEPNSTNSGTVRHKIGLARTDACRRKCAASGMGAQIGDGRERAMDYNQHYQDGKNGPLKKEIRKRIAALRTRGYTLADIGETLGFSGSFVSHLLNEARPGRVRSRHVPRIIEALEAAERERGEKRRNDEPRSVSDADDKPAVLRRRQGRHRTPGSARSRPRMFIASSAENEDLAYDVQESLEDDVESTVGRKVSLLCRRRLWSH